MVDSDLLPRSLREERFFRWRGGEVSRIEGLSDAVFALSLTLLVVALEVPKTGEGLVAVFWQFPAFILCFAFMLWVWYEHFLYHRRYGFEDTTTVALNGVLLFFIVFYVFPMKFLASVLVTAPLAGSPGVSEMSQGTTVMVLFSSGFVGIFVVLSVMYWRAWRLRDRMHLNAAELAATKGRLQRAPGDCRDRRRFLVTGAFSASGPGPVRPRLFSDGPHHGLDGVSHRKSG